MSTFNGWQIITLPAFPPAPKSIEFQQEDVVGENASTFSLQSQFYDWQQARMTWSVSYQPMNDAQFRPWIAFLAAARGKLSVFSIGDPLHLGPANGSASGGSVSGSGQTGFILNCSSSGMTPGDWIQIGLRLYLVTSSGSGTLGIWPAIRESPASGTSIVITNTTGLFRLKSNQRKYTVREGGIYGLTFEIEEAL